MDFANQMIFWITYLIFMGALVFLVFEYFYRPEINRLLKIFVISVLIIKLAVFGAQIYLFSLQTKATFLGKYLFIGHASYFMNQVKSSIWDMVILLALCLAVYLLGQLMVRYQKKAYLSQSVPLAMALSILILNKLPFAFALAGSLILAVIYQLMLNLRGRIGERVDLTPFILIASLIVLILSAFSLLPTTIF